MKAMKIENVIKVVWGLALSVALLFASVSTYKLIENKKAEEILNAPPPPEPLKLAERVRRNALFITVENVGSASAVFITKNMAMTAGHVCEMFDVGLTKFHDYKDRTYSVVAYKQAESAEKDICLVYITADDENQTLDDIPGTPIDWKDTTAVGMTVYIGGFSGGSTYSYRTGPVYVEEYGTMPDRLLPFVIEWAGLPIDPGASGSGVVNAEGKLVGIISLYSRVKGAGIVGLYDVIPFLKMNGIDELTDSKQAAVDE